MLNGDNHTITEGALWRGLLGLAGPMFISTFLQNAQSLIDLFWVGRLGSDAVAAIAVSGTVLMMLFPVVMGLATGTVAIISRAIGAGRREEASEVAGQSLVVAIGCGVVAGWLGWMGSAWLCRVLGASEAVTQLGGAYLGISFLGSFTVFVLFIGNSILQAAGNTVIPMWAMLLANTINMLLDPVLIFGWLGFPAMGVAGAAWATVISQAVAAAWVVSALRRGVAGVRVRSHHWRPQVEVAWRLMRVGVPSSGQMLSRSLMNVVLMRVVAAFGTAAVAAYGIGVRFHMIVLMPAFILGNAAATMVGQNLGAGQPGRAERAAWLAAAMDAVIMLASALVLMAWAGPMVRVFDDNPAVVETGTAYLRITSLFHVMAALSIVLGRALQGAGDTVAPMVMTIIGLWIFQVPLAIVLPRFFTVSTDGIWWSVAVTLTVHGVITAWWFGRGTWKAKQV